MRSSILLNRNVVVEGKRTSMKLEPGMWDALDEICSRESVSVHELCTMVHRRHAGSSLTATMRVFIVGYFRAAATDAGHAQAGHGSTRACRTLVDIRGGTGDAAVVKVSQDPLGSSDDTPVRQTG
jgi:predicted DNA-binding ribbon-helix-helix protein